MNTDTKVVGLSPHHYVAVTFDASTLGVGGHPQRLLVMKRDSTVPHLFAEEENLVNSIHPSLECEFVHYTHLGDALNALPEKQYTQMVVVDIYEEELLTLSAFLANRWESELLEIDGHAFYAAPPTDEFKKLAEDLNSPHLTLLASPLGKDHWRYALTVAALNARLAATPAKPYSGVKLPGMEAPNYPPKLAQRNELLKSGISTYVVNGKEVYLDRLVTTYTKNSGGALDPSFRDLNTKQILSALRYDLKQYFALMLQGKSLARDDYAYSDEVITQKAAKALVIARFRKWQDLSLVQDPDNAFAKKVEVAIENTTGSLKFFLPIVVMGQLYVTQTQINFAL